MIKPRCPQWLAHSLLLSSVAALYPAHTLAAPIVAKIHDIQGSGDTVTQREVFQVEAIVTGDFQHSDQLSGFFIQEEDSDVDGNAETSEGLFVYCGSCPVDVNVGDQVSVTGFASDFFGMSQLSARNDTDITILASDQKLPSPAIIDLPIYTKATDLDAAENDINAFYETVEGMLVTYNTELSITEYFELARFGHIVLSSGGRPHQFTDANLPSETGFTEHKIDLATRKVILDDDNNRQNAPLENETPIFYPIGGFSTENFFRGGDTIQQLTGLLHWSWPGSGDSTWRLRPVTSHFDYTFAPSNPRTKKPKYMGGNLKVASFNVLNYFTTIDEGNKICGPTGEMGCRGADSAVELERQTQKIVSAICALDADIVGLMELENPNGVGSPAINTLVDRLNQKCGKYKAINTEALGGDAITVGMIYRPKKIKAIGNTAILDTPAFLDGNLTGEAKNRPALAQSFKERGSKFKMTVVVNHFKSKGSGCGEGDDDRNTGQGNCNLTRTIAANEQTDWLTTHPTGVNTSKILVLGDLNAYRNEDPINAFKLAGFYDLADYFNGPDTYGYVFDGQLGYLDYALATWDLKGRVIDIAHWNINADEVNVLDYNDTVRDASERFFEAKPSALPLFSDSPYRSSDHDPVVIGIQMSEKK